MFFFFLEIFKNQFECIRALRFLPMLYNLFLILLFSNVLSLSFYNTSITGHIMLTLSISLTYFIFIVLVGYLSNQNDLLNLFIPTGVPQKLIPFLTLIEFLSFVIRPFSLAIRLFANMLAGHTLLNIFSSFFFFILVSLKILLVVPALFCFLITVLEFCVSFIQSYVFVVLLTIYLHNVLFINH